MEEIVQKDDLICKEKESSEIIRVHDDSSVESVLHEHLPTTDELPMQQDNEL